MSDMDTQRRTVALITAGLADDLDALEYLIGDMSTSEMAEAVVALTFCVSQHMQVIARLGDHNPLELWQNVTLRLSGGDGA